MRFAIDAHAIGRRLTGNEVYIRNLLTTFDKLDQESDFLAFISAPEAEQQIPERFQVQRVSQNPFLRLGWDMPRLLRRELPDLLHVQYTAPLRCPVPTVVSVHDVSFLDHPEFFHSFRALQLRWTVSRSVARADRILCPSQFSREAVIQAYELEEHRVVVAPNAVSPCFRPTVREVAQGYVRRRFKINASFVLTVGDLQPRKNHLGLLRAFEDLVLSMPALTQHLVFVGKDSSFSSEIRRAVSRSDIRDRVHFTGFVTDEDLVQLYNASDIFVFPSFYEGFGLPILEAMACGRAVACSNTSAMPEVANAAALQFNPQSPLEMTIAMRDLLLNRELRMRMERLGLQRATYFSWEKSAEKTLKVYHEVASQRRPVATERPNSVTVPRP